MAGVAGIAGGPRARLMWSAVAVGTLLTASTLASAATASPLKVRSATAPAPPPDSFSTATATCKKKERVVSGGFKTSAGGAPVVSEKSGARKWTVTFTNAHAELTAFAYCRRGKGVSARLSSDTVTGGGAQAVAGPACRSGATLTSGGFETANLATSNLTPFVSRRSGGLGWRIAAVNNNPSTATLNAFAYCQPSGKVKERVKKVPISPNSDATGTARCDEGDELISGGYTTNPATDWFNTTGPDLFYSQSHRSARRGWTAAAHNFSDVGGTMSVIAYCGNQATVHPKTG